MTHICDNRCKGDDGHHAWPSPQAGECLCYQNTHCPTHDQNEEALTTEPKIEGPYKRHPKWWNVVLGPNEHKVFPVIYSREQYVDGTVTAHLIEYLNKAYAAGFNAGRSKR